VVCLAAGLWVLFAFCHGTTGVQFGSSTSDASVHLDITTTGVPSMIGIGLTAVGAFLLIVATIIALIGLFQRNGRGGSMKRRENAFEE
jgi:hypothetical protein